MNEADARRLEERVAIDEHIANAEPTDEELIGDWEPTPIGAGLQKVFDRVHEAARRADRTVAYLPMCPECEDTGWVEVRDDRTGKVGVGIGMFIKCGVCGFWSQNATERRRTTETRAGLHRR